MDKSIAARRITAQACAENLQAAGLTPSHVDEHEVVASSDILTCRVQFQSDTVYFSAAKTFDRWANSRDYFYEGIPDKRDDIEILVKIVTHLVETGIGPKGESVCLNTYWRKFKKAADKEAFDQARRIRKFMEPIVNH